VVTICWSSIMCRSLISGHTYVDAKLQLRCAACHRARHVRSGLRGSGPAPTPERGTPLNTAKASGERFLPRKLAQTGRADKPCRSSCGPGWACGRGLAFCGRSSSLRWARCDMMQLSPRPAPCCGANDRGPQDLPVTLIRWVPPSGNNAGSVDDRGGPVTGIARWWRDVDEVVHDGEEVTESVPCTREEHLEEIRRLLSAAFEVPRFDTLDYLRWYYTQCPFGRPSARSHDVGRRRSATGGLAVPAAHGGWHGGHVADRQRGVHPGARREGAFLRMCMQAWLMIEGFDQAGIYG
jgi:hypothetical protein